jgi:hypothetical protein
MFRQKSRQFAFHLVAFAMFFDAAGAAAQPGFPREKFIRARTPVATRYIVRLKDDAVATADAAPTLASRHAAIVLQSFRSLRAFVAQMTDADARALALEPSVEYVEEDGVVEIAATQAGPVWGLDRIDQRTLPLNASYAYAYDGAGVHVYVIDSGIRTTHSEFGGRAAVAFDVIGDGQNGNDCNGHGTHVAGTIGGATYGVAKGVMLHAVRVLNCSGSGTVSGAIDGVDWVTTNRVKPAVANMSIHAGLSPSLDDAIAQSVSTGVTYVVAAGNDNLDACQGSPARAPSAITVGAVDSNDQRAGFSNFGTCVDLFAPGVSVTSAYNSGDTAVTVMSGTSMASPHVAGAAALYLSANNAAAPAAVALALTSTATSGVVVDPGAGSPNLLLYTGAIAANADQTPPTVVVTSPGAGATVAGIVTLTAQATDNVGVARVQFEVDQAIVGTDTAAPYSVAWNSSTRGNGSHTLVARAFDTSGNEAASSAVPFTVSSLPPSTAITAPAGGATVSGSVTIAATATASAGVTRVEFFDGATLIATDTTSPYSIAWDTARVVNGAHALTSRVTDALGASATSTVVSVTVQNAVSTPTELIVSGGFEPTVTRWTATGAAHFSTGGVQHTGIGYAYLGKANAVTATLSQQISIPAGTNPSLSFWLNITTPEPSTTVAPDKMFVEVLSSTGTVLATLATYSNLNHTDTGAYVLKSGFALGAYAGKTIRLQFRATTDAVNPTAFRIDDVSVSVAPPPPASELIASGGFEPTVTGWTVSGAAHLSTGGVQHTGIGYGYLGKADSITGALAQQISVPAGRTPSLSFWLNVTSPDPSTTVASDKMFVEVRSTGGALLATLATFSNLDKAATGAYVLKGGFALGAYAGQTIRIQFRATTDAVNPTAFRIDDVSVK